jgi:hypothetical protein
MDQPQARIVQDQRSETTADCVHRQFGQADRWVSDEKGGQAMHSEDLRSMTRQSWRQNSMFFSKGVSKMCSFSSRDAS